MFVVFILILILVPSSSASPARRWSDHVERKIQRLMKLPRLKRGFHPSQTVTLRHPNATSHGFGVQFSLWAKRLTVITSAECSESTRCHESFCQADRLASGLFGRKDSLASGRSIGLR
jgi:hypothetical protein